MLEHATDTSQDRGGFWTALWSASRARRRRLPGRAFRAWVLMAILVLVGGAATAPSTLALEVGQKVLARWKIQDDLYHYPAKVTALRADWVKLEYADGSKATQPLAAVLARRFQPGDFVKTPDSAIVIEDGPGDAITVRSLKSEDALQVSRSKVKVLLRTDHGLDRPAPGPFVKGGQVMAKWDYRTWYVGMVNRVQGEALLVQYADGSWKWIPADLAMPLADLEEGTPVLGVNKRDGQPVPAYLVRLGPKQAQLDYFDGTSGTIPLARLVAFLDQPGVDFEDPCLYAGDGDDRPHVETLRSWLTPAIHYYHDSQRTGNTGVSPAHIELGFALYLPSDREARANWKKLMGELARQVKLFLTRELEGVRVEVKVHPRPVRGSQSLAWYRENLKEADAWHVWQPTGDSVKQVFPDGPKAGRHRIVVVLPDAPGISSDSSGSERGMSFVRMKGDWFADLTLKGLKASVQRSGETTFSQWRADYLSTTIAHEALHTLGIPHTDGDPWSVMNIGPWYPIRREEVHLAEIHKIVLRSPFRSLSLSQGFAQYLLDPDAYYLETLSWLDGCDTRVALQYARGPGFFHLRETLRSFGPKTECRTGNRKFTGERAMCRAHLASFIAFVVERYGPEKLKGLFAATDQDAANVAAKHLGTSIGALERAWHAWLADKVAALEAVEAGE